MVMTPLYVRDVPDEVRVDLRLEASAVGVSEAELVRRILAEWRANRPKKRGKR